MDTLIPRRKVFRNAEDVVMYIAALMLVAYADGKLDSAEKTLIGKHARLYADVLPGGHTFDDLVNEAKIYGKTPEERRRSIIEWLQEIGGKTECRPMARGLVVDMIMLGHSDGEYSPAEKDAVRNFARHLGVSDSLGALEKSCEEVIKAIATLQSAIDGEAIAVTNDSSEVR